MAVTNLSEQATTIDTSSSRLVWILNRDDKPYRQIYRTREIVIPPNMEKIAKRAENGGNLMAYLEARRFISDYKDPQSFVNDSMGKPQPIYGAKALIDKELTTEEYEKIVGKTPQQIQKDAEKAEKSARRSITKEIGKRGNKISLEDEVEA